MSSVKGPKSWVANRETVISFYVDLKPLIPDKKIRSIWIERQHLDDVYSIQLNCEQKALWKSESSDAGFDTSIALTNISRNSLLLISVNLDAVVRTESTHDYTSTEYNEYCSECSRDCDERRLNYFRYVDQVDDCQFQQLAPNMCEACGGYDTKSEKKQCSEKFYHYEYTLRAIGFEKI